ncbi:MAG: glycosyltransferase [Chloroflexi bacterium]|nr:glycosyltransferase [Chloroflexota bacterium]
MLDLLLIPVAVVYLAVVGALFIFGVNFFYLTYLALRKRGQATNSLSPVRWPRVTVQLPIYNELYVAERLIDAAANLDYDRDLLEIQVLDDSTDETTEIVRRVVARWQSRGIRIAHLHRANRAGYKAGALGYGLERARGEFLAIFDADFIPPRDFLRRTVGQFENPRVAFVQTRWGHVNRDYSLFTFLQALAIDAHFMVEQFARSQSGYWFNFNGTAGIWRRAALADAGGWTSDTLTEDLDLSYRAFLRGWQAVYLRDVEVPAELPVSCSAYRRQQHRWARGSFECARKLLPQVWRAPISLAQKVEGTLHLTGYGVHLLLAALVVLYPFVLLLSPRYPGLVSIFGIALIFNVTTFAPTVFFVIAQQQLGRRWWRLIPMILCITVLGAGMMLNTTRAALQIALDSNGVFERTPKFGIAQRKQDWQGRRYQVNLDRIVFFELAFALFNIGTAALALWLGNFAIGVYTLLFCLGLLFTSGVTIWQTLAVQRRNAL